MLQDFLRVIRLFCTTAHNIATSKVMAIFTGCLRLDFPISRVQSLIKKRKQIKGSFCSPNAFNSDFDNYTWLKWFYSPQSLQAKLSYEAKIVSLLSFYNEMRLVTPLFCLCFSLIMATQKINLKEKKKLG